MKSLKIIIIILITCTCIDTYAQISGVSMDKLGSFHANVNPHLRLQFEPSFNYIQRSQCWDNNSNLNPIYETVDSVNKISSMNFRFTMGLFNKAEIGFNISPDLSLIRWAAKYQISKTKKAGFALVFGASIPLGNGTEDKRITTASNLASTGFGAVVSYQFSEKFSGDFTAQYNCYLKQSKMHEIGGTFVNADLGYYILNNSIQIMAGLGYQNIVDDIGSHQLLNINSGFALVSPKNYDIAFVIPYSVYGKNEKKNIGIEFYLTLYFQ